MEEIKRNRENARRKLKSVAMAILDMLFILGMIILFVFVMGLTQWLDSVVPEKDKKYIEVGRKYMRGELTIQDKMYGSERE